MLFFVKSIFIRILEWFPNYEVKKIVTKFIAIFFYWTVSIFTSIASGEQKQGSKFMKNAT